MTKKPSYRFVGFEDEWKEVKLGEILVERNEQISENEEYQLMSFVQGKGVVPKSDRYDRSFLVKDDKKNYKKTEFGDFIYSSNNLDTGSIGFNKSGKALISPVYSIFYSKTKKESQFIAILSQRKEFINEMIKYRQGVVYGQFRIHESDFLNISILAPESNAQEALINFFQDIDQLIILQQRKLEVLKEQKKTYLKLLFPAKGQTKPALRFAGFEDDWKEVKLGEIIQSISSKNYITEYYEEGNNPVIQQGDIPIVGFSDNKPFNNFSNVILFGDHTLSLFKPETPFLLATDGIKILHSDLTTQPFLFIMLERYLPKSQGYKRHYSLLKNELSSLPSLPEQEVIGSFFQDLDKAIAKQEEKVNQLKESKQTLLRKMFI